MRKAIVTNIPAFYKINMYNAINKKVKLLVIFTSENEKDRNGNFVDGRIEFDYYILKGSVWQKIKEAIYIIKAFKFDELILGGWDNIILWFLAFYFNKRKNAMFLESSYFESQTDGVKGLIKRLFVSRVSRVYASGVSQKRILDKLGYKGNVVITKGVGVFNYVPQPEYIPRAEVKNFLYVGRFVEVKNLKYLISSFNDMPQFNLYLAGFGEQEEQLRAIASDNVHFLGAINNKDMAAIYQIMDVFVLPSKEEPWGLVVEEALNNGLPVIVSDRVGCAEEIINDSNGLVFSIEDQEALTLAVSKMSEPGFYNSLRENISRLDFTSIEENQVNCYCN